MPPYLFDQRTNRFSTLNPPAAAPMRSTPASRMLSSGRGDLLAAEPEYATRYSQPVGLQSSGRGDLLTGDAGASRSVLMSMDMDEDYNRAMGAAARSQGGMVSNPVTGAGMSSAAALAQAAALRRQREMGQPNLAAQAGSGVRGRAPVAASSGSGVLDRLAALQNNAAANRFINSAAGQGGNTVEDRAARRDFVLNQLLDEQGMGRVAGMEARKQRSALDVAREQTRGRMFSAVGNMSSSAMKAGGADVNGDGDISDEEKIKYAEKLVKLQNDMTNNLGEPREPTEDESLLMSLYRNRVNPEQDGFETGPFPEEDVLQFAPDAPRAAPPAVTRLPTQATLDAQGRPLAAPQGIQNSQGAPRGIGPAKGPNERQLDLLRRGMNDPQMIRNFEQKFGAGSAAAYLRG